MRGPLGAPEIVTILALVALLWFGRNPRQLAADLEEGIRRFLYGPQIPRPELRGIDRLVLAIVILFLELIWFSRRF